jgi:hypothetical protein
VIDDVRRASDDIPADILAELEQQFFDDSCAAKLAARARGHDVMLSPNEAEILLAELRKRRAGRPPVDLSSMASYSLCLEGTGMSTEAAVAKTMEVFHVERATVFSARRKLMGSTESK